MNNASQILTHFEMHYPLPAATRNAFSRDLGIAQEAARSGVVPSRTKTAGTHWELWQAFCNSLHLDPTVQDVEDPVTLLQVFAQQYRTGDNFSVSMESRGIHQYTWSNQLVIDTSEVCIFSNAKE